MARHTDTQTDTPALHLGHRQRLRERFLNGGSEAVHDYELLEMLLFASHPRGDVKPIAKMLLNRFGTIGRILAATEQELLTIKGVNQSGIAALKVVRETARRLLLEDVRARPILSSWQELLHYCRAVMADNPTEQFRIFFLDKKNQLIADELQQQGTVDHTPVYPREVVKRALELHASAIILSHNHPSGDPTPSKNDLHMTQQVIQACTPLGVIVHDHLIIAGNTHYSFAANGML